MTDLDDELIPEIKVIIDELGKTMAFAVESSEAYDPTTGRVARTSADVEVVCSPPLGYKDKYVDGKLIKVGDVKVFLPSSGLTFAPQRGGVVTFDSIKWKIMEVGSIYTGNLIGLYELQLRK